jgi:MYXO-CTERM domain-containing protein
MFCTDILDEIPVPWGPWSATQTQSTDLTNINATWGPSSDGHSASGALPPFATDLTSESTELNEAAYLADAYVGNSIALTGANATDDVAAAYQLAIWQVLYNGLTVTNLSDASVGTAASYLVAEANGQTGSAEYYAAYYYYSGEVPHYGSDPKVSQDFIVGGAAGQGEIVPEPFTVGLGVLALGLAAYRRRRR